MCLRAAPLVTNSTRPASDWRSSGSSERISRQLAMRLTSITSWKVLGSRCVSGVSCPSTPALPRKASSLPQRSKIEAPNRSIASKSRRFIGTRVALPPSFWISSSASSSPPTVRATRMTWAPALASAMAEARPMPREAPVTKAIRPSREGFSPGCMGNFLGYIRQQGKLPRAAADVGERNRVIAGEAGVAEAGRGRQPLRLAHGAIKAVHGDEGQAVGADEAAHLLHIHLVGQKIVGVGRVHAIKAAVGGGRRGDAEMHFRSTSIAHHGHDLLGG